jgi:hypothetical protein
MKMKCKCAGREEKIAILKKYIFGLDIMRFLWYHWGNIIGRNRS